MENYLVETNLKKDGCIIEFDSDINLTHFTFKGFAAYYSHSKEKGFYPHLTSDYEGIISYHGSTSSLCSYKIFLDMLVTIEIEFNEYLEQEK